MMPADAFDVAYAISTHAPLAELAALIITEMGRV